MKKQKFWMAAGVAFLLTSFFAAPSQAVIFRMLDAKQLGLAASTNGSMAFKAKVTKVEQVPDGQSITFQIQDVLKGKIKSGDVITLVFPNMRFSNNLRIADGIPPPQNLSVNSEGVFFTSTRAMDGKTYLIGGDQGQFYVGKENGQAVIYNRLGNANLFSSQQMNTSFMKKVVQGMHERNSGAMVYEDFKKLINQ